MRPPLQSVIEAFAAAITTERVADIVVREAAAVVAGDSSVLLLLDGTRTELELAASVAFDASHARRWRRQPLRDNQPVLDVVTDGAPLLIETHAAWAERYPVMAKNAAIAPGARAVLPVRVNGRVDGVLCVGFTGDRAFSDDDAASLAALALHCGLALERCRAFADADAARTRTETLQRLSASLAHTVDVEGTCRALVDAVGVAFASAASYVVVDDGAAYRLVVTRGMDEQARAPWSTFAKDLASPTRDALQRNELLYFEDADAYERAYPWMSSLIRREGNEAAAIVPIVVDDRPTALLGLRFVERRRLDDETRSLLHAVAAQAGVAFARAHLIEAERAARKAAEEANRTKDAFLALLGHELRNPLMPITTAVHLLTLPGIDDDTRDQSLKILQRQSQHLVRLVDDLLDVSRIARGTITLKKQPRDLRDIVARAIETVAPLIERQAHSLSVDVASDIFVDVDDQRLVQVLVNLLNNAARYTPVGGALAISASVDGGGVALVVNDDGEGLDPALLPRVFEMFTQGPRSIDRAAGGLGLGLSLVKTLVELHGGTVTADSAGPGHGATFTVRLPLSPAPSTSPAAPAPQTPAPRPSEGRRVALVDDNVDLADSLARTLVSFGFAVSVFYDPVKAIAELPACGADIVVLDVGLPVVDGYELCRRLRPQLRHARFIALTGYGQAEDKSRALDAGFDVHLVKPLDVGQLLTAFARAPAVADAAG